MQALLDTLRRHNAAPVTMGGPITPAIWRVHRDAGGCNGVPRHLRRIVEQLDRHFEVADTKLQLTAYERAQLEDELYADLADRGARRDAEQLLAEYLEQVAHELPEFDERHRILELSASLGNCRTAGVAGQNENGAFQIAWDHKCGQVRLCPDESRTETQRVAERYVTAMHQWFKEQPGKRRIIYAVFTCPNFEPGRLLHGKRFTLRKFKDWQRHAYKAAPLTWRKVVQDNADGTRSITSVPVKTRKTKLPAFPAIKGTMVIQEDPLSARDDWNVHLNAFLLIDGRFDYKEARELWGWNVEFRELDASDPAALYRAAMEAVKYSAQIVPTKSAEKRERHATDAPAMIDWPAARWAEWWEAGKGFRRLRSYGALYRLEQAEEESADPALVHWLGRIFYTGGGYRVGLIPENNFSGCGRGKGPSFADPPTGPPGWH